MSKRAIAFCSLLLAFAPRLPAQVVEQRGAAALGELVEGLGTTARVLVIGAHPDDEDTRLIAWLAKGRHVETAYLSLTRGDGGQNLIGNQLGPELGMIRTEELLAARRIDGGHQFFTRAYDFGFTKTLSETMSLWPRDSILEDMVAIVRAFRPHIIISIWSGTPNDGHGQHQYSGVVARELFDAAADTVRFPPAKLGGLPPWTTPKFYRSRGFRGGPTSDTFNVGDYDPLLGESYAEVASVSRSQHRSQGQGSVPQLGVSMDGVKLEVSRVSDVAAPERTMFDGIDTSWARFKNTKVPDSVRTALDSLVPAERAVDAARNLDQPASMVAPLATYVRLATRARDGIDCTVLQSVAPEASCPSELGDLAASLETTLRRGSRALLNASGVVVDATAPRDVIAESDTTTINVDVHNEGAVPVRLDLVASGGATKVVLNPMRSIAPDSAARIGVHYQAFSTPTQSWWLRRPLVGDMFSFPTLNGVNPAMIEGEDRLGESDVRVVLTIDGARVTLPAGPIIHRAADRARGEVRRPLATVPAISVLLDHEVEYALANRPLDRMLLVHVRSAQAESSEVELSLRLPRGLTPDTATRRVSLAPFGNADVYFRLRGMLKPGRDSITAVAMSGGRPYTLGYVPIEYEHIRPLRYYRASTVQLEAVDATYANLKVGYVRGVGDNVMPMLQELGLNVTELDPATLPQENLSRFTTIVLGTRAYEADPVLVTNNPALMRFTRDGGTLVVQYGQNAMQQLGVMPYPIKLVNPADRVTDETAPVRVIDPGSPLLAAPNRITPRDFDHWVQERALYMPHTFDSAYRAVFSMNDPNEPPNDGALLVASLGKGTYIYTTMSFFRQLPAGNPGAARLFINLLAATQSAAHRPATAAGGRVQP